jgi:hypothetical protein
MAKIVLSGAKLKCSEGLSPGSLTVLPSGSEGDDQPIATVMDFKPMVNISDFGMCKTQANPQVATATALAQGVLTPQPCVPATTSPWSPGSGVSTVDDLKVLTDDSKCSCMWSGQIEITDPASGNLETD